MPHNAQQIRPVVGRSTGTGEKYNHQAIQVQCPLSRSTCLDLKRGFSGCCCQDPHAHICSDLMLTSLSAAAAAMICIKLTIITIISPRPASACVQGLLNHTDTDK